MGFQRWFMSLALFYVDLYNKVLTKNLDFSSPGVYERRYHQQTSLASVGSRSAPNSISHTSVSTTSHASGSISHASGSISHASGSTSHASGSISHASGSNSHASGSAQHRRPTNAGSPRRSGSGSPLTSLPSSSSAAPMLATSSAASSRFEAAPGTRDLIHVVDPRSNAARKSKHSFSYILEL